jgi:Glycosidases
MLEHRSYEGVVYQIYPRSFMDSNGDGIGDLEGIRRKIPYIASLGVDTVWLNPVYRSPNKDNGYDISDYRDVMEEFGRLADFDRMLAGFHAAGIRVVMDLVVNHCSSESAWFKSARSSKDSPFRDFFIWKKGADGPPNNWKSFFGGSAWEPVGGEYYLHLFHKGQPDLNWENEALRKEIYAIIRFWLERGVDGFRMDAITMISKDPSYRDLGPDESPYSPSAPFLNGPRLAEFLREMEAEAFAGREPIRFGECPGVVLDNCLDYLGGERPIFDLLFMGDIVDQDRSPTNKFLRLPFDLRRFKRSIAMWQNHLHGRGGNSFYLMNHDQPRSLSRFGDDRDFRVESGRALMMLQLSLEGTPFIYQGEEIGMTNARFGDISMYRDIETLNYYQERAAQGADPRETMAQIMEMSRDNSRTPMQWTAGRNAGFSEGEPWIPLNEDYRAVNVEAAERDPDSILAFSRRMIAFRKAHPTLVRGDFTLLAPESDDLFAFLRAEVGDPLLALVNFSGRTRPIARCGGRVLISTHALRPDALPRDALMPWEGRIMGLDVGGNGFESSLVDFDRFEDTRR